MAIEKIVKSPMGADLGYHEIDKIDIQYKDGKFYQSNIYIKSWINSEDKSVGKPNSWRWDNLIDILPKDQLIDAENNLVAQEGGMFQGGIILDGTEDSLDLAKLRKLAEIKRKYEEAFVEPLTVPTIGTVDCGGNSDLSILKTVILARELDNAGYPVNIAFTLYDNSEVILNLEKTIYLGMIYGNREQTLRARKNILRNLINSTETIEELNLITWDMNLNPIPEEPKTEEPVEEEPTNS